MARILRYPYEALTETTDYLQIDAKAYQAIGPGLVGKRNPEKVSLSGVVNVPKKNNRPVINEGTVFLPIPSNIQDGNAVGYGDDSLNGIVAAAVEPIKDMASIADPQKVAQTFKSSLKSLNVIITDQAVRDALNRSLASQAVAVFGGNVTPDQILARQSGEIFNPNMELLFNGVTLRAFKFQFKLTPRDKNEADEIRNIIRFFKSNMSPQAGTLSPDKPSYFLRTPNVFQLTYKKGNGEHPFLHKFKLCALESMAVNYTGENVYATYGDGTPVSMIMDLSFKELEPIYASDYDTNQEGVGY